MHARRPLGSPRRVRYAYVTRTLRLRYPCWAALDAFAPKSAYLAGVITEADQREYNGWAKIGCILLTMEDELEVRA